jgi:hypothetical protein
MLNHQTPISQISFMSLLLKLVAMATSFAETFYGRNLQFGAVS